MRQPLRTRNWKALHAVRSHRARGRDQYVCVRGWEPDFVRRSLRLVLCIRPSTGCDRERAGNCCRCCSSRRASSSCPWLRGCGGCRHLWRWRRGKRNGGGCCSRWVGEPLRRRCAGRSGRRTYRRSRWWQSRCSCRRGLRRTAGYASGQPILNPHSRARMLVSTHNCVDTWTQARPSPVWQGRPSEAGAGTLRSSRPG